MKQKIRKGDTVEVISGRAEDKKKRGEVIRVIPAESRVVVQGVNIRSKHQGQTQAGRRNINPGIIKFEAPIHVSNVMLVCPKCNAATRVGFSRKDGKVTRICKKCHAEIDA
ncbi:MAG: 50S ribosomal protein L24 [Anaerolineaceae bacterium]|nr:50S ribosomal protein L24 [Anaerolineaceae bacterium]